jgi:hypothetical protein
MAMYSALSSNNYISLARQDRHLRRSAELGVVQSLDCAVVPVLFANQYSLIQAEDAVYEPT